jgi:hypothetical protein
MKTIFIIISIFIGLTYGQKLEINKNEDKQREQIPELMREPFLKPLPVFGPPMEPMLPAFRSILDDENPFPSPFLNRKSPFDRIHGMLNNIPKIIKNDNSFKRWPPLPDRPFFSSISMVSKSDDSPFSPLKTVSEVNDETAKEKQGSGLPVFHPKISSFIDQQNSAPIITIVKGMIPFVSHIQTEQNQEINSSVIDPQLGQLSIRMGFNVEVNDNISVTANLTDSDLTESSVPPFKEMINTVVESFAKFKDLLKHTFSSDRNETKVEDQNKDKTQEKIIKSFVVQCDCPQDKHEDNCPNNERNLKDSIIIKAQMKTNTEGIDRDYCLIVYEFIFSLQKITKFVDYFQSIY